MCITAGRRLPALLACVDSLLPFHAWLLGSTFDRKRTNVRPAEPLSQKCVARSRDSSRFSVPTDTFQKAAAYTNQYAHERAAPSVRIRALHASALHR